MDNTTKAGKNAQTIPAEFFYGWLDSLDKRTAMAKELWERFVALTNDLGGADRLSYIQRSLCEFALWLEFWLALQARALAEGRLDDFDAGKWTQGLNTLLGLYKTLGLKRVARDVPELSEWLRNHKEAA